MEKPVSEKERLKYEIARQEGLLNKLLQVGWAGLSAAEAGRIGGLVASRLSEKAQKEH